MIISFAAKMYYVRVGSFHAHVYSAFALRERAIRVPKPGYVADGPSKTSGVVFWVL